MKKLIILIFKIVERFNSFEGTIFVSSLAYSLLLGFAPLLLVLVLLFSRDIMHIQQITAFLAQFIPSDIIHSFIDFIINNNSQEFMPLIIFTVIGFWIASRSLYSFLLISSKQDDVDYPAWFLRALSLFLFAFLFFLVLIVTLLLQLFFKQSLYYQPLILLLGFCLFYRFLAFRYYCLRDVFFGALFASIVITGLGGLFFFVIDNFTTYQSVYGPMASIMILLLSSYIVSSIIYIGFCLNFLIRRNNKQVNQVHYTFIFNFIKKWIPSRWLK